MPDAAVNVPIWGHQIPVLVVVAIVALVGTIVGALIAAIITLIGNFVLTRQQSRQLQLQLQHDFNKEHFARRQNLLEKASEDFEAVHNILMELKANHDAVRDKDTSVERLTTLSKASTELLVSLDNKLGVLLATEGKLLLAGLPAPASKVDNYREFIVEMMGQIVGELASKDESQLDKHMLRLEECRTEFYKLLSNVYCEPTSLKSPS